MCLATDKTQATSSWYSFLHDSTFSSLVHRKVHLGHRKQGQLQPLEDQTHPPSYCYMFRNRGLRMKRLPEGCLPHHSKNKNDTKKKSNRQRLIKTTAIHSTRSPTSVFGMKLTKTHGGEAAVAVWMATTRLPRSTEMQEAWKRKNEH